MKTIVIVPPSAPPIWLCCVVCFVVFLDLVYSGTKVLNCSWTVAQAVAQRWFIAHNINQQFQTHRYDLKWGTIFLFLWNEFEGCGHNLGLWLYELENMWGPETPPLENHWLIQRTRSWSSLLAVRVTGDPLSVKVVHSFNVHKSSQSNRRFITWCLGIMSVLLLTDCVVTFHLIDSLYFTQCHSPFPSVMLHNVTVLSPFICICVLNSCLSHFSCCHPLHPASAPVHVSNAVSVLCLWCETTVQPLRKTPIC